MKYKTIDLFAGAGGLSLGFKMSGYFDIVAAAEINKNAQSTYLNNIPNDPASFEMIENVIGYNFTELNKRVGGIDVVIGGPPCQGFSNANRQKNHLISMNNALVKEYFRAIKEIKPKAFLMENVKTLSSDKHRFFESEKDNDQINVLREKGAFIPLQEEVLFIAPQNINELFEDGNLNPVWKEWIFPQKLDELIRVFNKNLKNEIRLTRFIDKNKKEIIRQINYFNNENNNELLFQRLKSIQLGLISDERESIAKDVSYLATLQKALHCILELEENQIIGNYRRDIKGNLIFETRSYSVIDYANAVLGETYIQTGGVLNSKWFGVPQDRKRHIIVGFRRDVLNDEKVQLPGEPASFQEVTVRDAIYDLKDYPVSYNNKCDPLSYRGKEILSPYEIEMRQGSSTVKNHIVTATRDKALERFAAIKQGENFHSLDETLKDTYSKPERTQNTIYLRLAPDSPSGTVVNVRKSMWIHPELNRAISVREAARLQSFPDLFEFIGTKDSQYQQVGNAVPPLMAKELASIIKSYL